jgi:HK97 family phage prohead protease
MPHRRPPVELSVAVRHLALDTAARTITGTITVYNSPSTSQRVLFHDGALRPREPLRKVKMLREHVTSDSVGYMTEFDGKETATFYVPEGANGDRALEEAANGIRDGLSVGFHTFEYLWGDDETFHVYDAELYEVSLCAIPDMADAGVTNVTMSLTPGTTPNTIESENMNPAQLATALAGGTITQATHDRELGVWLAANPPAPAVAPTATPDALALADLQAGPEAQQPHAAVHVQDRGLSLAQVTERLSTAVRESGGRAGAIVLALADIIPAMDQGTAFINREDWIGELFTARETTRPWIDSFGTPQALTGMVRRGWRWTDRVTGVAKYAGNKTPVPTGTVSTEPYEVKAERWAGGWDIDRAFVDFGDTAFLSAFWEAATDDYKNVSDADVAIKVMKLALANQTGAAAADVLSAITRIASRGRRIKGAQINRFVLAPNLFDQYAALTKEKVPFWLANSVGGVDLQAGSITAGQITVTDDPDVPDNYIAGYDSRAARVFEKAPLQVQALDVARGGVDLGLYSYGLLEVHDPRLFLTERVGGSSTVVAPGDLPSTEPVVITED